MVIISCTNQTEWLQFLLNDLKRAREDFTSKGNPFKIDDPTTPDARSPTQLDLRIIIKSCGANLDLLLPNQATSSIVDVKERLQCSSFSFV